MQSIPIMGIVKSGHWWMICGIRYTQRYSSLSKHLPSADTGRIISTMRDSESYKEALPEILKRETSFLEQAAFVR